MFTPVSYTHLDVYKRQVITYDVLQEPALAGLKVSRLGFDEDTDAALLEMCIRDSS